MVLTMRNAILWLWRVLGSTLILLLLVNIAAHVFLVVRQANSRDVPRPYERLSAVQRAAYGNMSAEDVDDLLHWTWRSEPGFVYEPVTGFHEAARSSRFVNVSSDGVRLTKGAESDLSKVDFDRTLLMFGGSTMFGYGVADDQTIPSHLQRSLPHYNVVNLGRAYYYSAQENSLLLRLLQSGFAVRDAVFLDGINERCDVQLYQTELDRSIREARTRSSDYSWNLPDQLVYPVRRLASGARAKIAGWFGDPPNRQRPGAALHRLDCRQYGRTIPLHEVALQNLKARDALCRGFAINCITFVQPFAGVHGLHLDEKSLSPSARRTLKSKFDELEPTWKQMGAVDISDALARLDKHAYVDNVHYSDEANELIAARMLQVLSERFAWR
jgi:hypothetical protein